MLKKLKDRFFGGNSIGTYIYKPSSAFWKTNNYGNFAQEAYIKNVIAHRAINMISTAAASVPLKLKKNKHFVNNHHILHLLTKPNPLQNGKEFFESIYSYRQISGNAYIIGAFSKSKLPLELYALRPDKVSVVAGSQTIPEAYHYKIGKDIIEYKVNPINGRSQLLHIKNFNPLSHWYGLSSIEAAAYSIDQHNNAGEWNQALLQNGARPSGAIVVNKMAGGPANLTDKQYQQLKQTIDEAFAGPKNAGKPILLEGGLDWKEMSLTPKDMDFIESKHSAARDIALALGVPPQLLGIPGDNTYSNLAEARLAFWEQTVIPLIDNVIENFSNWLTSFYSFEYKIIYDLDNISALSERRENVWRRVNECSFITLNEKRAAVGLNPLPNGDAINYRVI